MSPTDREPQILLAEMTLSELERHIDTRISVLLEEHAEKETAMINRRFDELERLLKSGYPGGDPDSHRRAHEEQIEYIRERRMLWRSVREKTITALIWAMLVGIGAAVWQSIKAKLGS